MERRTRGTRVRGVRTTRAGAGTGRGHARRVGFVVLCAAAVGGLVACGSGSVPDAGAPAAVVTEHATGCDDPQGCAAPSDVRTALVELEAKAGAYSDYVVAETGPDGAEVVLYWHGPIPAEIDDLLEQIAETGIRVETVDAPYTLEELQAAIVAETDALSASGTPYRSVGDGSDYASVTVSVPDDDPALQARAREVAVAATSVPITIVPDPGPATVG